MKKRKENNEVISEHNEEVVAEEPKGKKQKVKKTPLQIFGKLFAIISLICTVLSLCTLFAPIFVGVLYIIFGLVLVIISIFTLFLIWVSDEAKATVGTINGYLSTLWDSVAEIFKTFPWFAIAAFGTGVAGIVLNAIAVKKGLPKTKSSLILSIISVAALVILAVIFIIIFTSSATSA